MCRPIQLLRFALVVALPFLAVGGPCLSTLAGQPEDDVASLLEKAKHLARLSHPLFYQIDETSPKFTNEELDLLVAHLRLKYPFEDLSPRLKYEHVAKRVSNSLSKETKARLDRIENPGKYNRRTLYRGDFVREDALKQLHSDKVTAFITREGFGLARLEPSVYSLEVQEPATVSLVGTVRNELSAGGRIILPDSEPDYYDVSGHVRDPNNWARQLPVAKIAYNDWLKQNNPHHVLSQTRLNWLHFDAVRSFSKQRRFGYVKDLTEVAGFAGHSVTVPLTIDVGIPRGMHRYLDESDVAKRELERRKGNQGWQVAQLQLISLLKYTEPRAYISTKLPRMAELASAKTRSLSDFESDALVKLYAGEDLQIDAQKNRIRMVGSLRAMQRCQDCHSVHHGELLGALTYEFVREADDAD